MSDTMFTSKIAPATKYNVNEPTTVYNKINKADVHTIVKGILRGMDNKPYTGILPTNG